MNIPDEAVEAAWKVMEPLFLGRNRERCRDSLILALDAAMPHILTHQAESLRAASDFEVAQNIRVSLAMGLKTAARLLETDEENHNE